MKFELEIKPLSIVWIFLFLAVTFVFAEPVVAQNDGPQTRSATSEAFRAKRPGPKAQSSRSRRPTSYKYVRTQRNPAKAKSAGQTVPSRDPKPDPKGPKVEMAEIGLTMWKLRPPIRGESGYFFTWERDGVPEEKLVAERVSTTNVFNFADKVRIAVESSVEGYLYIVDRETNADGTVGTAYPIFPETPDENNKVGPGLLFDIPYALESNPWLKFEKRADSTPGWDGELLTIIISPTPLDWFVTDKEGRLADTKPLVALEDQSESEVFDRTDMGDKMFSKAEAEASCGVVTRGIGREERSKSSCGNRAKRLNPDEPQPQTIFRTKTTKDKPIVVFARIALAA